MSGSVVISSKPPTSVSQNYAALREQGMEIIRQLASETWTDHNVHDPGITLHESFCYAMTELGLRIQLDMPDLLQSGITHAPPDFVPAHLVLPCAPVTLSELRKVLLDNPLLSDARITTQVATEIPFFVNAGADPKTLAPPYTYTANGLPVLLSGLYGVVLEFSNYDLNSNAYSLTVKPNGYPNYTLDIAMTYWDEDAARVFQNGPAVISVVLNIVDGIGWLPLPEPQSFFGEIDVDIGLVDKPRLWILMRIVEDVPTSDTTLLAKILGAATSGIQQIGAGSLIDQFGQRVRDAYVAVQQIQNYFLNWRNLCEEPVRIEVARMQEIAVHARIEVTGSKNLEQLLADIFLDIDRMLTPRLLFQSLEQRRTAGDGVEQIYDGPLLLNGFLDSSTLAPDDVTVIYTSDILRIMMRHRGNASGDVVAQENPSGREIVAVSDLTISNYINNRPITVDVKNCLHLVEVERYRPRLSLSKSHIVFVRNEAEIAYDLQRVETLLSDMRQADMQASYPANPSPVWPVELGDTLPIDDFIPAQNDLPAIYGVGEARLPDTVSTEQSAAVMQLKGYLLLYEQFLADLTAQLGNINRFFSSSADEKVTYFSRALFDLPEVQDLLVRFTAGSDWTSFVADPENPYVNALQQALESQGQFLDRRNRMLDHLLARQGEDMVAFSQELHRYAQKELFEGTISPGMMSAAMLMRRQAANKRLIRAKAALLHDVPRLNATRLQAFGNPVQRNSDILQIEENVGRFRWTLSLDGEALLQSVNDYASNAEATITAEEAMLLAVQTSFYITVSDSGRRRYQLQVSSGLVNRIIAESPKTYASNTTAQSAAAECAQRFAALRLSSSQTPLEQRITHMCGIRSLGRRLLVNAIDAYFEIYDEVDSDSNIEKRWRLWEHLGHNGRVMLSSVFHFAAASDAEATALAEDSIKQVLRYGQDEWNYLVSPAGTDNYNFDLVHPSGAKIGMRTPPLPSEAAAYEGVDETVAHLYQFYSVEGFHLVEHLLLRPRQNSAPFIALQDGPDAYVRDAYSQRLSLVFPSGYMRDFSLPADSAPRVETEPHRFRDLEFRRHVERMVQQACPAHLLPGIYWVDRRIPDSTDSTNPSNSFDGFEQTYFAWLNAILTPGTAPGDIETARTNLLASLNGVANGQT